MTLSSTLLIKAPVPAKELFRFCQSLLGDPDTMICTHALAGEPVSEFHPNWLHLNNEYRNRIGQGLAAIVEVEYGADGPLVVEHDEPSDPDDDDRAYFARTRAAYDRACVKVWLDTTYGYRANNGAGCADLHAWIFREVYGWCAERGVTDVWFYNEFTGEWFASADDLCRLGDADRGALPTGERGAA